MTLRQGSERHHQQRAEQLAAFYGWRVFHAPDNVPRQARSGRMVKQRTTPGFPDLVLVRDVELLFAELKTDRGRVSRDQREWLAALETVAAATSATTRVPLVGLAKPPVVEVHLWRLPSQFDAMHERLARGRRMVAPSYQDLAA